jgi:outer membrane protein insertion porin family
LLPARAALAETAQNRDAGAPPAGGDAGAPAPGEAAAAAQAEKPELLTLEVKKVQFRGNRKVEDDALRVNLRTVPGAQLTQDLLREDVRAIWRMGFFEDVQVEANPFEGGVAVVFVLKEKPSIRKIYVSGHEEVGLTKINEVLDIKKEQILDLAKIKKNMEKIRELYLQRGYYMADVTHELKRVGASEVDVYFRVHENAKVEVRRVNFVGNNAASDSDLRAVMLTQETDLLSFVTQAGTYREDVFQRDMLLLQSYYQDRGYIYVKIHDPKFELSPDKRSLYITIPIEEGNAYTLGKIEFHGDLLEDEEKVRARLRAKNGETFSRSKLGQDIQELTEQYRTRATPTSTSSPRPRSTRTSAWSTSPTRSSAAARCPSTGSTSAATPAPGTRSSAGRCASSRASPTTAPAWRYPSAGSTPWASSNGWTSRKSAATATTRWR